VREVVLGSMHVCQNGAKLAQHPALYLFHHSFGGARDAKLWHDGVKNQIVF